MYTTQEIDELIEFFKNEMSHFPEEDDFDIAFKKTFKSILTNLVFIRNTPISESPNTLGLFVRTTLISQREHRLRILTNLQVPESIPNTSGKTKSVKTPTAILENEIQALARCYKEQPIRNWNKYKDLQLISHDERSGRKGKKYMLLYTPIGVIYLFQSRFGPWLTIDAEMDAKKTKKLSERNIS